MVAQCIAEKIVFIMRADGIIFLFIFFSGIFFVSGVIFSGIFHAICRIISFDNAHNNVFKKKAGSDGQYDYPFYHGTSGMPNIPYSRLFQVCSRLYVDYYTFTLFFGLVAISLVAFAFLNGYMKYKFAFPAYIFICLALLSACKNAPQQSTDDNTVTHTTDSSWALLPFEKIDTVNPVLGPGTGVFADPILHKTIKWEEKDVFNPAIVVRGDTLIMLYRAEDSIGKYAGTSRIGLAKSTDGLHFTRMPSPVFFPANDAQKKYEWEGGCEDPRVVEDSAGTYYMMYTAYDGDKARLLVASSKDLLHWTKYGPAFSTAYGGKYLNKWSKSGSVVSVYKDGKITAVKINGKYWMYWGDVNINAATSDDLVNWQPLEMNAGEKPAIALRHNSVETPDLKIVIGPRPGKFDSDIVEPGPPAMLTSKGILLIYNGRNIPSIGDTTLAEGTYSAGQVLLDKNNPATVLQQQDHYFLTPDKAYEKTGQVNFVCFVEGLANFKNKWFLYYGTADSKIAVAVKSF